MDCWTDDWVVAWLVVWLVGLMDGWMDERMIGCMNGSNCHYLWHKHPMYDWKQNVFQSRIITLRNNRGNNETDWIGLAHWNRLLAVLGIVRHLQLDIGS